MSVWELSLGVLTPISLSPTSAPCLPPQMSLPATSLSQVVLVLCDVKGLPSRPGLPLAG